MVRNGSAQVLQLVEIVLGVWVNRFQSSRLNLCCALLAVCAVAKWPFWSVSAIAG
jgi:hypothetical protein